MKSNEMKKYVIGFLVGFFMVFLLGARTLYYVDGHCQSSLSSVSRTGEVYLAVTNTSTGKTIVRRFDKDDFAEDDELTFDAALISKDRLLVNARQ